MTLTTDSYRPTTIVGVYREHFKQITTSNSHIGRIWHAIVFGTEVLFFPIAIIEVAFNRYQESSTLIGRKVKKASNSQLSQYPLVIKNLNASVSSLSSIENRDQLILPVTFQKEEVLEAVLTTPTIDVSSHDETSGAGALELIPEGVFEDRSIGLTKNSSSLSDLVLQPVRAPSTVEEVLEVELSKNLTPSLVENKDLLLSFLKKHNFPAETIGQVLRELVKLSPNILKSFLKELVRPEKALWHFITFESEDLRWLIKFSDIMNSNKITVFDEWYTTHEYATSDQFDEICQVAKALYAMESSIPNLDLTHSPPLELMHTSPGLQAARGNQVLYQKQFTETVVIASEKINKKSFNDVLEYIAGQRHEMAKAFEWGNVFGIRRSIDSFHTDMIGPYEKYRDLFLKSDKQKWKLIHVNSFSYCGMAYQIEVTPKGKERPIQLTRIQSDVFYGVNSSGATYNVRAGTSWFHTPTENIDEALKEAERIFNELPDSKTIERTDPGLETIMRAVGELHWWLAQACPYQRGSAAIAKMTACAVLKHYGIEPGGFGSTEPDCMALIQHPDEFIENYSKLMMFPPPHWILAK